jgi:hypothetical protein
MKRAGVIAVAVLLGGTLASASAAVKLPKERTSPTGNFFTLYAFDQPTKTDPVASALMQVWAR